MKKSTILSVNPATLEIVGSVHVTPPGQVEDMVQKARAAFPKWYAMGLKTRVHILKQAQQILLDRIDEFSRLITLEMGRPYVESYAMESEATIDLLGYYAHVAHRFLNSRRLPLHNLLFKRRTSYIHFRPLGVMGIITPWNWPLLIPLGCIAPALLAGNAIVFKPSELTPLVGEKIKELFIAAGMPEDVMQVVQGYSDTGSALVNSSVEKIFFTGSTAVGQKVMQQAADQIKPVVLELGGNDPAIVCADADIDNTSSGLVWGSFSNCGQNCNSIERVYVHKTVADALINLLMDKIKKLKLGNGMDMDTDIGPLASENQLKKMSEIIRKAKKQGVKILAGGEALKRSKGYFFQPTLLLNHNHAPVVDDEIFGPMMVLTIVKDDDDAIRLANHSSFGLAGSVWTKSLKHGKAIAHRIESGTVMINDAIVSFGLAEADWTGVKKSGVGWVHGHKGLDEMVNMQYINAEPQFHTQKFWWFPYHQQMVEGMKNGLKFLFSSNVYERIKVIPGTVKFFASYLLLNKRRWDKI
jgi:acyl-CoA reductase-like NAD-dependent aldehyde dehydrogenase